MEGQSNIHEVEMLIFDKKDNRFLWKNQDNFFITRRMILVRTQSNTFKIEILENELTFLIGRITFL